MKTFTGHSQGVEDAYNRFSLEDMSSSYKETMQYLVLGSKVTDGSTKQKVEEQALEMDKLTAQNRALEDRLAKLEAVQMERLTVKKEWRE